MKFIILFVCLIVAVRAYLGICGDGITTVETDTHACCCRMSPPIVCVVCPFNNSCTVLSNPPVCIPPSSSRTPSPSVSASSIPSPTGSVSATVGSSPSDSPSPSPSPSDSPSFTPSFSTFPSTIPSSAPCSENSDLPVDCVTNNLQSIILPNNSLIGVTIVRGVLNLVATDSIVISGTTEFDRDAKLVSSQNLTVTISGQIVLNDPILGYQELVSSAGGIVISDLSFVTTDPCLTVTAVQPTTTSFGALVSSDNTASECRENTSDNNQTFWYWIIVGTVGGICLLTLMVVAAGSITLYYGNHRYGWLFRAHLSDEPDGSSPI